MLVQKIIITIFCGICIFFVNPVSAGTIYVDKSGGGDYQNIQEGISAAYPDDTVEVAPGIYEENVTIDKGIKLGCPKNNFLI